MNDVPWSLHLLAEVLASFDVDDPESLRTVLHRVAEAVDAEVAAVVGPDDVGPSVGLVAGESATLTAAAAGREPTVELAVGSLHAHWAPLGPAGLLLTARLEGPFDLEERSLLRAMARSIELSTKVLDAVAAERRLRSALDRALVEAVHQATHDRLTGLPSRTHLLHVLAERLESARRGPRRPVVAALFVDVDRFKRINDALGHAVGDRFLVAVAERLRAAVRTGDLVGRLAGDEFVVVCELDDEAALDAQAERLLRHLAEPIEVAGRPVSCTVSIGMACADDGEDAETLVDNADLAMYVAKQAGRGRAVRFDRSLRTAVRERAGLEVELRQALERGGIEAFYQPVVRLGDAAVVGFEALARWRHPERGLIPPDVFVPIAEETGLIAEVDRRVLRDACGRIAAWNRVRPADPWSVSVNVSARTFADPGLPDEVAGALAHSGLAAGHLFLEITETVMMEEADSSVEVLERLTELGVRLAVDDFGTGYSSLRYLRDLPVAILKLDRSFVGGLGRERDDRAIVEAVVHLARSLRLSVTAEGVETPHQAAVLTALGCPYGQGFLFGRPVPADAIDPRPWRPALAAVATAGP